MVIFKLKSFPNISETFIVSNIIYALKNNYKLKIYSNKIYDITHSSQQQLLSEYKIENLLEKPKGFSNKLIKKAAQYFMVLLLNPKILFFSLKYYFSNPEKDLTIVRNLFHYRNFPKKNVCHVHFNNALQPLLQLSKLGFINPKVVVTFHGYDAFLESEISFKSKYGEFYKSHVKYITVNSNYIKKAVTALGVSKNKIKVVPIGIDCSFFSGQPKALNTQGKIKLLTVGRLVQLKGQIYGLNAVKNLIDKGYDVAYTLIGKGEYKDIVEKEIIKLKLTKHVKLIGKQTQKEIKSYMNDNDIFLMTSTFDDVTKRCEAFGLVSIEAQAMGMPVIGFKSGGFPDTIIENHTGFAVEDRNFKMISEKIEYFINTPKTYSDFSKKAIAHAQKFDNQYTTKQYLEIYNQILKNQ